MSVWARPVYDPIAGPSRRLDVQFQPRVPEAALEAAPHGIVGQSFDGDGRPRVGRRDVYDRPVVRTSAMAEGAIDGVADDYRVAWPFETEFRYARFAAASTARQPRPARDDGRAPVAAATA